MTDLSRWLADEVDRRGLDRFALIGHDWGGTVATLFAAGHRDRVVALVIEEEILPGIDVGIPSPGNEHYPTWHGPFNRSPGPAEQLVPVREDVYLGTFLRESAGPAGLDEKVIRRYIDAYSGCFEPGLGYYRTRTADVADVESLGTLEVPVLAIGGRFAMGSAVAAGMRAVATTVTEVVLEESGHYPIEQQPELAALAISEFLQ